MEFQKMPENAYSYSRGKILRIVFLLLSLHGSKSFCGFYQLVYMKSGIEHSLQSRQDSWEEEKHLELCLHMRLRKASSSLITGSYFGPLTNFQILIRTVLFHLDSNNFQH